MFRKTGSTQSVADRTYLVTLEQTHREFEVAYTQWMTGFFLRLRKNANLILDETFAEGAQGSLMEMAQLLERMSNLEPGKHTKKLHVMVIEATAKYLEGIHLMRQHISTGDFDYAEKCDDALMKAGLLMRKWYQRFQKMRAS